MTRRRQLAVLFAATMPLLLASPASAQTSDALWRSWQALEDITEARAGGLGGAVVALADDASTARYNPAGLTRLPKNEIAASLAYRGKGDRPNGDTVGSTTTLGEAAGALALSPRWAIGGYLAQSSHQHIELVQAGHLDMDSLDGGVAVAWHPAERVHLGARLTLRHLRLSGAATDSRITVGTAGGSDEVGGDAGLLVEVNPDLHLGLAFRQGVRWSDIERTAIDAQGGTVDPGSLYQVAVPTVVSAGLAWHPTPRWAVAGQLDYVALGAVHDTLSAADPSAYELDDAIEPRIGVEYSHPMGSATLQIRGGLHYQASRSFRYTSPDPAAASRWAGEDSSLLGAGGLSLVTRGGHRLDLAAHGSGRRVLFLAGGAVRF